MPPLEAWEKVWINGDTFVEDVHAYINCTTCHGGQSVDDMDAAHEGMVVDPSNDPETGCATCHPNLTPHAADSLHVSLAGYDTALHERSTVANFDALETMESYHCNSCHSSCGQCHVSQPTSVGGGLLEGHTFVQTPPMSRTCTGCHGSRVKNEYYGLNEGYPGDVHLRKGRMACTDCHTGNEMHGLTNIPAEIPEYLMVNAEEAAATPIAHRYDGLREPTCEACHAAEIGIGSGIPEHEVHPVELLACEVCHSVSYTNCTNCHVDRAEDGTPFYTIEAHNIGFYIGLNPERTAERPYKYVPVRHVPVDPDSFSSYGDNLLVNFLNRPTWTYATPHNTQLDTPQTLTCLACHENDEVFLTSDKVTPEELGGANLDVIVDHAPLFPEGYEQYRDHRNGTDEAPAAGEGESTSSGGSDADFWGSDSAPAGDATATPASDADFWGSDSAPAEAATATPASDADFWGSDSTP